MPSDREFKPTRFNDYSWPHEESPHFQWYYSNQLQWCNGQPCLAVNGKIRQLQLFKLAKRDVRLSDLFKAIEALAKTWGGHDGAARYRAHVTGLHLRPGKIYGCFLCMEPY